MRLVNSPSDSCNVFYTFPDILLEEVILVDDYSDGEHMKGCLANKLWGYPRCVPTNKREGLVPAWLLGAYAAKCYILTSLDCHCESHREWLEPLLQRVHKEDSAVVCLVIDVINGVEIRNIQACRELL